jgi:hypothetical protein
MTTSSAPIVPPVGRIAFDCSPATSMAMRLALLRANSPALSKRSTGSSDIRLIFFIDRLGRGGDHYPFYQAGLPAVRFTEPLEDYTHQHQTLRTEGRIEYGDKLKYLSYAFMGNVARDNAEALRQLALAPAPPLDVVLSGGVTPDAKIKVAADADDERAGFEILWRETTSPRWQVYSFTKDAGEVVLKSISTDNHYFGVRSLGKNGARSIAVPAHSEQRLPPVAVPAAPKQ